MQINNVKMEDYRHLFSSVNFSSFLVSRTGKSNFLFIGPCGTLTDDFDKRICDWIIQ